MSLSILFSISSICVFVPMHANDDKEDEEDEEEKGKI